MRVLVVLGSLASVLGAQQFAGYPSRPSWQPLGTLARPGLMAMADIDGDGDGDLAVVDSATSAAYVRRNLGNQSWSQQQVMPLTAWAMAWADLDRDGDLDLLLGGQSSLGGPVPFGVLRNDGAVFAWLGQVDAYPGPGDITAFATGDVDGDLDLDVLVGGTCLVGAPALRLYRNDGAAHLSWDPAAVPALAGTGFVPVLADVDRDGDQDLLAAASGALFQLTNTGTGTFADASAQLPPGCSARALAAGDLDRDGFVDLLTCDLGAAVLWNSTTGVFAAPQPLAAGADRPLQPLLADVDGDGALDVVVRTQSGLDQHRYAGNRAFARNRVLDSGRSTTGFGVGDTFARGLGDAICSFAGGRHSLAVGSPGGLVADPVRAAAAAEVGAKAVGDLDGDGRDDVLTRFVAGFYVLRNLGRGNWSSTQQVQLPPAAASRLQLAHLDGDGRLDAVALVDAGVQACVQVPASLTFQQRSLASIPGAAGLGVGDVDGDGDADVVATGSQGALWLANPGDGALLAPAAIPGTPSAALDACWLGDLDGDGDPDLLLGSLANCLQVHWNDGAGGFTAGPCLPFTGARVHDAVVADLDGDGRLDVASCDFPNWQVRWFRQEPGGTFAARGAIGTAGAFARLHAGDVDDDGDQDLVAAGEPAKLFRNGGAGAFALDAAALGVGRLNQLAVIDLDQDGDLDLFGDPADTGFGVEVENRARSARSLQLPRVGGALQLEFLVDAGYAAPGTLLIPGGTLAVLPGQQVPGVHGALFLDAGAVILPWLQPASPAGSAATALAVPLEPAWIGLDVVVQALTLSPVQGLGLGNVVVERIMP